MRHHWLQISVAVALSAGVLLDVMPALGLLSIPADEIETTKTDSKASAENASLPAGTKTNLEEHTSPPTSSPRKKTAAQEIGPERFREVDTAADLMVWLMSACGLGGFLIFLLIIVGARRMRRMTRTQVLKSKYDELEMLREKHRREIAQLEGLEPPRPDK
jgi:hypothetical protein